MGIPVSPIVYQRFCNYYSNRPYYIRFLYLAFLHGTITRLWVFILVALPMHSQYSLQACPGRRMMLHYNGYIICEASISPRQPYYRFPIQPASQAKPCLYNSEPALPLWEDSFEYSRLQASIARCGEYWLTSTKQAATGWSDTGSRGLPPAIQYICILCIQMGALCNITKLYTWPPSLFVHSLE